MDLFFLLAGLATTSPGDDLLVLPSSATMTSLPKGASPLRHPFNLSHGYQRFIYFFAWRSCVFPRYLGDPERIWGRPAAAAYYATDGTGCAGPVRPTIDTCFGTRADMPSRQDSKTPKRIKKAWHDETRKSKKKRRRKEKRMYHGQRRNDPTKQKRNSAKRK